MINVTKTFLPPLEEYTGILQKSWDANWITNRGALIQELEQKLKDKLQIPFITLTTNGTLPLQIAIKALGLKGEIITTPFSYVATTSSIVWENCTPVFVDIHPTYWTIDEALIEKAITPNTSAILVTHVFGNPCDVERISEIASKHKLKVIYDAAHCYGVNYNGKSIFSYGDVSTCSFHATKVFHTGEGGAMISQNKELHEILFHHHNFGHKGVEHFHGLGINAKMSELQAAMGISVLPHMDKILAGRKAVCEQYKRELINVQGITLRQGTDWNYAYYPVVFNSEETTISVIEALQKVNINPRRYFYPCLSSLNYVKSQNVPVADLISRRILCLPLYADLGMENVHRITKITNAITAR